MEKIDKIALTKISYGLYVITMTDGQKDNAMICNTVMQVSNRLYAVSINKANFSHDMIRRTGKMNINVLSEDAPFSVFQDFGFRSGKDVDKLENTNFLRSANGLPVLTRYCNAFISLQAEDYIDMESHGMFICHVTEAMELGTGASMTYSYYHANVKPKPGVQAAAGGVTPKKGYVCTICGYVYEGDELPADFICPLCKHPASDFVKLEPGNAPAAPTAPAASSSQKYVCDICKAEYDPAKGDPEHGIPAGTPFEQLPDDWVCPICGVGKENFKPAN
ncbi:MAG: rubredoxin [Victivallales bacterium]|nr:rubredoxin [Victivallales bacterium]